MFWLVTVTSPSPWLPSHNHHHHHCINQVVKVRLQVQHVVPEAHLLTGNSALGVAPRPVASGALDCAMTVRLQGVAVCRICALGPLS